VADANHPTRAKLLEAGLALAEDHALTALSIEDIVSSAGVAKGTFYVHFPDRGSFFVALYERFNDQVRSQMREAVEGLPPGRDRLEQAANAYLDGALTVAGVRAMLGNGLGDPAMAEHIVSTNDRFARSAIDDLTAMHRSHPLEAARLFVAMTAQIALLERMQNEADPNLRAALSEYLD
jgi:AcrR family transcriptional regulator